MKILLLLLTLVTISCTTTIPDRNLNDDTRSYR